MGALLQKVTFTVNDDHDFVHIKFGSINARIGYRIGISISHYLRMAAKEAARFHRAPASFWRDIDRDGDLNDCPHTHRFPRQSKLAPTVSSWSLEVRPPLVALLFDGSGQEMDYETAVRLSHAIRRASRRAKAWAGDSSSYSALLGNLTDAEEDYRLGIAQ